MLSIKLIKEVLKEAKYFPQHAYKVGKGRIKNGVYPHQKYSFGKDPKQYFCWFEPEQSSTEHLIIFYHGGGWTFGTPEVFSDRAKLFTDLGYSVIMPSHRKLPKNGYPEIREDLILTLKKINEIKKEKDIAYKKIILGGMSSGGNLAALLLLDKSLLKETGFKSTDFVAGFFCCAPLNLAGMTDSFVLSGYAGKRASATFENASPITHLPRSISKPILIIHGTEDGLVNYHSSVKFANAVKKINKKEVSFYTIPNGSHLKAVSWTYEENEVRMQVIDWLESI